MRTRALLHGGLAVTLLCLTVCSTSCQPDTSGDDTCVVACNQPEKYHARVDYSGKQGFWSQPFPSDARRDASGRIPLGTFPNEAKIPLVGKIIAAINESADGFSLTSGIFFPVDGKGVFARESAPLEASIGSNSSVFLVALTGKYKGERVPVTTALRADTGPFGSGRMISLVPLQGRPLRPATMYAAGLSSRLDTNLAQGPELILLRQGKQPAGMSDTAFEAFQRGFKLLGEVGVESSAVQALTIFTTGNPAAVMFRAMDAAKSAVPTPDAPLVPKESFEDFCVFEGTVNMPTLQHGTPPFASEGGGFKLDGAGVPIRAGVERSRVVVTLPKRPMPTTGYPSVVFSRTGGGGERPLVDRGVRAKPGGPAVKEGAGPAATFARAGYAAISIDGPHGGLRNVSKRDEQFLMFNVENPTALRDNVRESAVELGIAAEMLTTLRIDSTTCLGSAVAESRFDPTLIALMGHSMGATIAPLSLAAQPRFRAVILSGAGGSYIENVMWKKSPVAARGFAEIILGYTKIGFALHPHDPVLSLLQWAAEASDPPIYGDAIVDHPKSGTPRNVLMLQGIVDTYILPPIANATSLSMRLDLAGGSLDVTAPALKEFTPLAPLLPFAGTNAIGLPVSGNRATATAVVVQHLGDSIEDGHEAVFQTEPPKHQYRCFLETLAKGVAKVPSRGTKESDVCD